MAGRRDREARSPAPEGTQMVHAGLWKRRGLAACRRTANRILSSSSSTPFFIFIRLLGLREVVSLQSRQAGRAGWAGRVCGCLEQDSPSRHRAIVIAIAIVLSRIPFSAHVFWRVQFCLRACVCVCVCTPVEGDGVRNKRASLYVRARACAF